MVEEQFRKLDYVLRRLEVLSGRSVSGSDLDTSLTVISSSVVLLVVTADSNSVQER